MTTEELFALGLERVQTLARMIENSRSWYFGRRLRRPDELLSAYFEPKKGLGIDYFRKTIRHLANGGFMKVDMKSAAAVAFREGNERVLTMLKEMEPVLSQHIGKEDSAALRRAIFFFRSGQDMFFDMPARFEPIVRWAIRKMRVDAFCIDSLQRYLGAVARAFAIREAQLTGQPLVLPAQKGRPLAMPAGLGRVVQLLGLPGKGFEPVTGCVDGEGIVSEIASKIEQSKEEVKDHVSREADREIAAKAPKRKRKFGHEGNGLKGPKTKMMEKQRKIFFAFLKESSKGKGVSGKSRISRAHQCWLQHPEWDRAAKASGEAKGYASHKSLAQAR